MSLLPLAVFWLNIASAQVINGIRVTASDGAPLDRFGSAVSIDGDYTIVGAVGHADNGSESGAAYMFMRVDTTWMEMAKLTASDGAAGDEFGFSVAMKGDYAVVGAPEKDDIGSHSGAVYVFQRNGNTWAETGKLSGSFVTQDSHFGWSVSIDGDYLAAGATGIDSQHPGLVYIFQRIGNSWTEVSNFFTPDIGEGDNFGSSLSISGEYVIVGDENYPAGGASGAAYVFKRNGASWTNMAKLTASDAALGDQFAWTVSINGDYAVVSAPSNDDAGESSGSVYIFGRQDSNWVEITKLTAGDAFIGQRFGWSASIRGNFAVAGAIGPDNVTPGAAYVFQRNNATWSEIVKFITADIGEGDLFGSSVSISDQHIVIGDENFPAGVATGSAYVFTAALLPVGIDDGNGGISAGFVLNQNYPNPFNPSTTIRYELPTRSYVVLKIFNLLGQEVATLIDQTKAAGRYEVEWEPARMSSAIYFYRLQAGEFVETKKLVVIK